MDELIFHADEHRYEQSGETLPSVTRLTGIYGAATGQEDDILTLTLEAAAERGTVLHSYLEHRLSGGEREDFEIPDVYSDYADSADLFLSEHKLEPLLVETPLSGELNGVKYAGTPDCVGVFDGELSILDWKFVSQVQKTKVGAQLNGYLRLCGCSGFFPERLYCVQFLKDGTYRLYPVSESGSFALCADVWREKHKKHPRGGIA